MRVKQHSKRPPTATAGKPCGHREHVGTCPACQRVQLAKWQAQEAQAQRACYAKAA
jgi:hypothetical protein